MTDLVYKKGSDGAWETVEDTDTGGGSDPPVAFAQIMLNPSRGFELPEQAVTIGGTLVGGSSFSGAISAMVVLPPVVFGSGIILDLSSMVFATLSGSVESTADDLIVLTTAYVVDAAGTNRAWVNIAQPLSAPVTDLARTADFTGADWDVDIGTDLSAVDLALSSAAGGTYVLSLQILANWD